MSQDLSSVRVRTPFSINWIPEFSGPDYPHSRIFQGDVKIFFYAWAYPFLFSHAFTSASFFMELNSAFVVLSQDSITADISSRVLNIIICLGTLGATDFSAL